ncbi:YeiH family protein [Bradyrhizobium cenepequi]
MSDRVDCAKGPTHGTSAFAVVSSVLPGIVVCVVITTIAISLQAAQESTFGHPYLEAIVIAILIGTAIRTFWTPGTRWRPGIAFSAKQLLEVAVALLGASIAFSTILASGPMLLAATVLVVVLTIVISYTVSRSLGLSNRLSILVACGNSICGNSAIAAVAPLIGARSDEIASSIAFTAILGVIVVLGLPLLIPLFALSEVQYGILAGMTVYAVPQVLAATMPASLVSAQIGTVVKLVRVMMLGPVVASIAYLARSLRTDAATASSKQKFFKAVPWFIIVFFALAALRSLSLIPDVVISPIRWIAGVLTVLSMAALGLGVDLRMVGQVGARVTAAVTLSLLFLIVVSFCLVRYAIPT